MVRSVRKFDFETDWDDLVKWYSKWDWPIMPKDMFPSEGFIVPDHACAWLYQSDSSICWLEWITTNPDKSARSNFIALEQIYDAAIIEAQDLGFTTVFSSFNHRSLIKLAEKKGFEVTDRNMTNLVRAI